MNILALDTGITTGYCVMLDTGSIVASGNIDDNPALIKLTLEQLQQKWNFTKDNVIVEYAMTPTGSDLNTRIKAVNEVVHSLFPDAYSILPGTWKTSAVNNKPSFPRYWNDKKLTQHQKDSICIARWFLRFQK